MMTEMTTKHCRRLALLSVVAAKGSRHKCSVVENLAELYSCTRAYKCGISKDLITFQDLLHDSGAMLFRKCSPRSSMHCLNTLLAICCHQKRLQITSLEIVILVVLPQCSLNVFKRSFINWCLFYISSYITIVT